MFFFWGFGVDHLLGDGLGHLLGDGLGHLLGDTLVRGCLLSSSSSERCSPRLAALMCGSPPPPQSRLALGLGAAVSRGRGVPELCPHLALHMEVSLVRAQLRHAPPLVTVAPRPSAGQD